MYQELLQFVFTVAPNYKGIVNVSKLALWFVWNGDESIIYFECFHNIVCYYRTERASYCYTIILFKEFTLPLEVSGG